MSDQLSPDAALEKIPVLSGLKWGWQELPGGLTNRNFKVDTSDASFVLRLDSKHTADLGLDRELELKIRENAHAAGLGAAIVHAEAGTLLSEFLPGSVWKAIDLKDRDKLEALATLLRKVHALPRAGKSFSSELVARQYAAAVTTESGLQVFAGQCQELLAAIPITETFCCCHNDIVAGNIIQHSGLKLLDWEYACDNDPMFDLASVIGFHDLDAKQVDSLFDAYAGGADPEMYERLQNQVRLFDIIQWLWFAARQCSSPDPGTASRLNYLRSRITTSYF
jgi:thiamine kinase